MYCHRVNAQHFYHARKHSKRFEYLTLYTIEQFHRMQRQGYRFYLTGDYTGGYMLSPEGDLQSVFNAGAPGTGQHIVRDAIFRGAQTLDCFDGFLPQYYARFGFRACKREPFNPQYMPAAWDLQRNGRPDVVYMKRT